MAYVDGKELEGLELAQALRDRYLEKNSHVLRKMTTAKMNDDQKLIKKIYFRLLDKVAALTDFEEKSEYMQMIEAGDSDKVIVDRLKTYGAGMARRNVADCGGAARQTMKAMDDGNT